MTSPRADSYLTIPPVYGEAFDGIQWGRGGDAIETADGITFAVSEEIEELLAGVFAGLAVPHFAHVLTAYHLLKAGRPAEFAVLRRVFADVRGKPHVYRNAGRLIAVLCEGVPPAAHPPTWEELKTALARLRRDGEHRRPHLAIEPSLVRSAFEAHLSAKLAGFSTDALRRWLTHGTGPADDGTKAARELESLPARVAAAVAVARTRPRLAGAAFLVPALDAALTLPPRRRTADAVPQGGYADVTNRGDPDRLLPSQLALDPDEFVRRFAENELLFFRREEPHTPRPAERLIVLDQGVRTWGGVRLGLAAAAAVLLGKEPKKAGPVRFCPTSVGTPIDPGTLTAVDLADRLEASDLSADPAGALVAALTSATEGPRDVVLLTHTRALNEPPVIAAAHKRQPADRLFALAVADCGRAELVEWLPGGPVPVRSFKLDLAAAEGVVETQPAPAKSAGGGWSGDCEPIAFPFRPGLVSEPAVMGFDADEESLVVVGRDGVPQWLRFDGSAPEVLPRGMGYGRVLRDVTAVVGVRGGVTVSGSVIPDPAGEHMMVVVHYDFSRRIVRVHDFGPSTENLLWGYASDLHCVRMRVGGERADNNEAAVDLDTGGIAHNLSHTPMSSPRASRALGRELIGTPLDLPVRHKWSAVGTDPAGPFLKLDGNAVRVAHAEMPWQTFEPTRDGRPLFAGAELRRAVLAGEVLTIQAVRPRESTLHLFRGPDGRAVRDIPIGSTARPFAVSPGGRWLATSTGRTGIGVHRVSESGGREARADWAALHGATTVTFRDDPFRLAIGVGTMTHVFSLEGGQLRHTLGRYATASAGLHTGGPYDPQRFRREYQGAAGRLRAVADMLGQVAILAADGRHVASFLVRREKAAAWAVGDARFGDPALLGTPPTANAAAAIGTVLLKACGGAA